MTSAPSASRAIRASSPKARRNSIDIPEKSYNKNRQEIELANGSKIRGFSAEKPESIRGENLSLRLVRRARDDPVLQLLP